MEFIPLFVLVVVVLAYFWVQSRGEDIDKGLKDLNKRLDRLEEVVEEDDHYTSTACWHEIHRECRRHCKWCERPCQCECHDDEDPQNFLHDLDDPRHGIPTKSTGLMADLKNWWSKR